MEKSKIYYNSIDDLFRKPPSDEEIKKDRELSIKLWNHWKHFSAGEFLKLTGKK